MYKLLAFAALIFLCSCKRNGTGGTAEIGFIVAHHGKAIPGAIVYIKYGAKDFPGKDISVYDDSKQTGSSAHAHFTNLLKGDYYLYATGYDSSISQNVSGGLPVKISKKGQIKEVDLPVTE